MAGDAGERGHRMQSNMRSLAFCSEEDRGLLQGAEKEQKLVQFTFGEDHLKQLRPARLAWLSG